MIIDSGTKINFYSDIYAIPTYIFAGRMSTILLFLSIQNYTNFIL